MDRQTNKHSPRVDDQMRHEVQSLVQGSPVESHSAEDRLQEGPIPDASTRFLPPGGPLSDDELELRSDTASSLRQSSFPADRATLLEVAGAEQAPEAVLELLRRLPEGQRWDNFPQVWTALGGHLEPHRGGGNG